MRRRRLYIQYTPKTCKNKTRREGHGCCLEQEGCEMSIRRILLLIVQPPPSSPAAFSGRRSRRSPQPTWLLPSWIVSPNLTMGGGDARQSLNRRPLGLHIVATERVRNRVRLCGKYRPLARNPYCTTPYHTCKGLHMNMRDSMRLHRRPHSCVQAPRRRHSRRPLWHASQETCETRL